MGFATLGFGVCAGHGSVGCVWSVCVMGVMGVVAVFLRYFRTRELPGGAGHGPLTADDQKVGPLRAEERPHTIRCGGVLLLLGDPPFDRRL